MKYLILFMAMAFGLHGQKPLPDWEVEKTSFQVFITQWEGFHGEGIWSKTDTTVGIGHNVRYGMAAVGGWQPGRIYTKREIAYLFDQDYEHALACCRASIEGFDGLPRPARQVALSLVWSCGQNGFKAWKNLIADLNGHLYSMAASELLDSKWRKQVGEARLNNHYNMLDSIK